jgi:formate dehydrogenase major subunit
MQMISVTINGNKVAIASGATILKACEAAKVEIPTLCHDERLQSFGSCRLCVVEVQGARTLTVSCSTPATEGMVIQTESERVLKARKDNLELLWGAHDNDCLTCEKAGNCKLQDYCYAYGIGANDDVYSKRIVKKIDESNPFYQFDNSKCILCGKCVNMCDQLVGARAIDFTSRGFRTEVAHPFMAGMTHSDCVSCGNCVSVCPTGALLEKTSKKFRTWDVDRKVKTTCTYCGVGCQMDLIIKDNKVVRVDPAGGGPNNETLCVKGKFGYKFIDSTDRLKTPLIRKNGQLTEATWDEALTLVADKMIETKNNHGANSIGAMASARCTNEENYMLQKLMRGVIGTNNIDHCARL